VIVVGASFLTGHKSDLKQYRDCLSQAGNSSAAQQDCARRFSDQVNK